MVKDWPTQDVCCAEETVCGGERTHPLEGAPVGWEHLGWQRNPSLGNALVRLGGIQWLLPIEHTPPLVLIILQLLNALGASGKCPGSLHAMRRTWHGLLV